MAGTNPYFLSHGSHKTREDGLCAMEWVAYIAGEPHTDQPVCVSPILRGFCMSLNDTWDDQMRQRLRPYLARCVGTAGDGRDTERGFLGLDWQIRTYLPAWLELAGLTDAAGRVRELSPITDLPAAEAAGPVARAAQKDAAAARTAAWAAAWDAAGTAAGAAAWDAAWDAAGTAARAAAWDAVWDAAGTAAGDAVWDAARTAARTAAWDAARAAARAAAWDAVWDAAGTAAWDAARTAAGDALAPTVRDLQESALDLLDRMLPTVMIDMPQPVVDRAREVCGL